VKTTIKRMRDGRIKYTVCPHHEMEMGGIADDALGAAERAFTQLDAVARSPLGAVLPPGLRSGASTLRAMVSAARRGKLDDELAKLPDRAKRAAANVLNHIRGWL